MSNTGSRPYLLKIAYGSNDLAYYPPDPAYRLELEHCNVNGGFVLGPSNVLFKEIPPKNTVAMYEAVD